MKLFHFRTNVLIKDIIGKGLINDDNLAIVELVKNSFDAKASDVTIVFKFLTNKTLDDIFDKTTNKISTLTIQDSGEGMNDDDLENKWLNIAYSEKKDKSSITSHVFAGDKGVGRFSCDRLGKHLNLFTKRKDQPIYHLEINWLDFEKGSITTTIQSIGVVIKEISASELKSRGFDIGTQGTILEMTDLRSNWTKSKIKTLKVQYLSKLINPNQKYVKNNVRIILDVPDFPEYSGPVENQVFEKLEFRTTSIEAYTSYDINKSELILTTILRHRGQEILTIKEKNNRFSDLKNVRIVVYYLNSYAKVRFYKESGERTKDYGSIFLFLNGFRVSPYGEAENDWLGLEMRKAQGQKRFFSARDIVGRIEVTDFDGKFKPVSSREGLIKDTSFNLLVDKDAVVDGYDEDDEKKEYGLFYQTITALEKYVVNGLWWDSPATDKYLKEFDENTMKDSDLMTELYAETDNEKDRRCLDALQSIIRIRKGEILSIEINNDLVLQLLEADEEKSRKFLKGLEKYASKIEDNTAGTLSKIKAIFEEKDKEIERQRSGLSEEELRRSEAEKRAASEEKKRLVAEEKVKKAEEKTKEEEIKRKEAELKALEAILKQKEAILLAEQERRSKEKLEFEKNEKEKELEVEKKKNIYLSAVQSSYNPDAHGIIHHILDKSAVSPIIDYLINMIKVGNIDTDYIINELITIKRSFEKIQTLSKLITKAGFIKDEDKQKIDIPAYIEQYINNYYEFNPKQQFSLECETIKFSYYKIVSPLEISIIIDNLISNAKKWKATKILFKIEKSEKNLIISVSDNGEGLSKKMLEKPEQIFELGITQTTGSGIGLYFVRDLLKGMGGKIKFDGNGIHLKGANFLITLS